MQNGRVQLFDIGEAVFHGFGCDFEEFESGPGNFSTAIVEWPDGRLENVPVHRVRFVNGDGAKE